MTWRKMAFYAVGGGVWLLAIINGGATKAAACTNWPQVANPRKIGYLRESWGGKAVSILRGAMKSLKSAVVFGESHSATELLP